MLLRTNPIVDFGKYKGTRMSEVPQSYLAWIVGYSGIGSTDFTLPWEQASDKKTYFKFNMPIIYSAAMKELVRRNRCLACDKPLVPFKSTEDWNTRLIHKKCYTEHIDDIFTDMEDN